MAKLLLVTGPFDGGAHLHPTGRQNAVGIPYSTLPLTLRENEFRWPGGSANFSFDGNLTTTLNRAQLSNGADWLELPLDKGRILFSTLLLELSDNLHGLASVYRYATKVAKAEPAYTSVTKASGMLICPTEFPNAMLYVATSETSEEAIAFVDRRGGRPFSGRVASGGATLLLSGTDGRLIASDDWQPSREPAKSKAVVGRSIEHVGAGLR